MKSDYTTVCIQIDMHIESLISDSRTNKRLMRIRNKLTSKKRLKTSQIELLVKLGFISEIEIYSRLLT